MQCPVCHTDQLIVEYHDVELDMCVEGCGTWFDADELRQLFEAAGAPGLLHDLEERLEALPVGTEGSVRRCPRCRGRMRHVRTPGASGDVILDRCRRGHGLWFDKGELEEILKLEIDTPEIDTPEIDADGTDTCSADTGNRALANVREFLGQFVAPAPSEGPSAQKPSPQSSPQSPPQKE
jgi:Zn-finger nucleic acid-binding protein